MYVSEVESATNKSVCPSDNLLNDYCIESSDILSTHITDMFNNVLSTGYLTGSWAEGYIVPLHKKGNINDANNYPGITLMSNFGKLFVNVLNNRVNKWCEKNSILTDAQFGFRKNVSTTVRFAYTYITLYEYECTFIVRFCWSKKGGRLSL